MVVGDDDDSTGLFPPFLSSNHVFGFWIHLRPSQSVMVQLSCLLLFLQYDSLYVPKLPHQLLIRVKALFDDIFFLLASFSHFL